MTEPSNAPGGIKAKAKALAAPVVSRARDELARAAAAEHDAVRGELAALRAELERQRGEHAAEVAALHEELAAIAAQLARRDQPKRAR